jgi:hypothetical protein
MSAWSALSRERWSDAAISLRSSSVRRKGRRSLISLVEDSARQPTRRLVFDGARFAIEAYNRVDGEDDERLRARLARECYDSAARRWARLLADADERRGILSSR